MTFQSILFQNIADHDPNERRSAPDFFVDLALDQIVAAITVEKEEYGLNPFFYVPLHDVDAITFRHEIMQDLENIHLFESLKLFAGNMRILRQHLDQAGKLSCRRQQERWFLDAVAAYCDAVTALARDLALAECTSRGLSAFREYVTGYAASECFNSLLEQTQKLKTELSSIRYCVLIKDLFVQVRKYAGESDFSAETEVTFERFKQGDLKDYPFEFNHSPEMNGVEAKVLDQVVQLYPEIFSRLENYCASHQDFPDATILTFDKEIQFYITYLDYIAPFKNAGLHFCYPRITQSDKEVYNDQGFDLALAGKLIGEQASPVCNDFHLKGRERIIVVSGPNQGGKTTFARTFGQLHFLASLGCPVPGAAAQLYLFDRLFTHFEREEDIANLRGKLQDDLVRIHTILEGATPGSILIINEIFASTTFQDALALSKKIASRIMQLDLLCVWVTFVDELATLGEKTVSMAGTVVPGNPALRTYKIIRRPADGLAYALSIVEKYRLTYARIKERIGP